MPACTHNGPRPATLDTGSKISRPEGTQGLPRLSLSEKTVASQGTLLAPTSYTREANLSTNACVRPTPPRGSTYARAKCCLGSRVARSCGAVHVPNPAKPMVERIRAVVPVAKRHGNLLFATTCCIHSARVQVSPKCSGAGTCVAVHLPPWPLCTRLQQTRNNRFFNSVHARLRSWCSQPKITTAKVILYPSLASRIRSPGSQTFLAVLELMHGLSFESPLCSAAGLKCPNRPAPAQNSPHVR
jgi:hypothetical protein